MSDTAWASSRSDGTLTLAALAPAAAMDSLVVAPVSAGRPLTTSGQARLLAATAWPTEFRVSASARPTAARSCRCSFTAGSLELSLVPPQPPAARAARNATSAGRPARLLGALAREVACALGAKQVDHEHQGSVRRDARRRAFGAVAEFRRHDQFAPTAHLHPGHSLFPTLDDLALAERERKRFVPFPRRVEDFAAVEEGAHVVDRKRLSRFRFRARAGDEVPDDQFGRRRSRRGCHRRFFGERTAGGRGRRRRSAAGRYERLVVGVLVADGDRAARAAGATCGQQRS